MEFDVYKIDVDDNDETGMKMMSIVTTPAIQSNFLKLKDEKMPKVIALKDENGEYKQVLAGLALIPNKYIYRLDKENQYEYFVYFDAQGIEKIRNKFHKEGKTNLVNLQHSATMVDAYLIESYIINSEERLAEVKAQGIEDATMGSWYVQYKVEDKEVFEKALENQFNGFSIEIQGNYVYDKTLLLNKNNNYKNNNYLMSKFNKLIDKFKSVLQEFEEVQAKIADTDTEIIYAEVGEPVYKLVPAEDEGGEPQRELMPEGEIILDNGSTLVIDENGNLAEIKEQEAAEPINDEELQEMPEETPEEIPANEVDVIEEVLPHDAEGKIVDGDYIITVHVEGGEITEGVIESETQTQLLSAQEEIVRLKAEIVKLEAMPMAKPLRVVKDVPEMAKLTKEEKKKLTNLEIVQRKLGLA
jgi:hypothetical protein